MTEIVLVSESLLMAYILQILDNVEHNIRIECIIIVLLTNPPGASCVIILDKLQGSQPSYKTKVSATLARHLSVRASVYFANHSINF